jgi:hypothetical protein
MKTSALCSMFAMGVCCCAVRSSASSVSVSLDIGASANAGNVGHLPMHQGDGFRLSLANQGVGDPDLHQELSHSVNAGVSGSFGPYDPPFFGPQYTYDAGGTAFDDAYAYAGLGVMRLATNGAMLAITSAGQNLGYRQADAEASAIVVGTWQDGVLFAKKNAIFGQKYTVHATLALSGDWTVNVGAPSTDPWDADAGNGMTCALKIEGTGVPRGPYFGGDYYYAYTSISTGGPSTNIPPPQSVPISFSVNSEIPINLSLSMTILASESVGPSATASSFDLNLSHSLVWDGIDYVTDDATGETVTDWTITSESGVDYSKPVRDVPEPSSLILLSMGATTLVACRRCSRRRNL